MAWLMLASIIWAFSFGIVKNLTISTDPFVVNLIRACIATLFFCLWQFMNYRSATRKKLKLANPTNHATLDSAYPRAFVCGAIQLGLMYGPYTLSFRFIKAHEVALFTMTTPLFMAMFFIPFELSKSNKRNTKLALRLVTAIILATVGGAIATYQDTVSDELLIGAGLVQLSNIFFATGSVFWAKWFAPHVGVSARLMVPFFAGFLFVSAVLCALFAGSSDLPDASQFAQLVWLGAVSSGLGFFLWNKGAISVSGIILSVANNLKLPLAILVSVVFFSEKASPGPLILGIILIALALNLSSDRRETRAQH